MDVGRAGLLIMCVGAQDCILVRNSMDFIAYKLYITYKRDNLSFIRPSTSSSRSSIGASRMAYVYTGDLAVRKIHARDLGVAMERSVGSRPSYVIPVRIYVESVYPRSCIH